MGLVASIVLAQGSLIKALGMVVLGLLLGLVGTDVTSGTARFAFGSPSLPTASTSSSSPWACSASPRSCAISRTSARGRCYVAGIGGLLPSREDMGRIVAPILRGTVLGALLGILPGGGALLASFAAYSLEKKVSPRGAEFGTGAIEGVAAPEAANNAGAQTSFIPMLTLGIPSNPVMALMIGALIIQGIRPGPNVMVEQPKLFWGVIASMWVGNLFLLVLNLPMIGLWVRLLTVPYHLLYPIILVFSAVGVLSLSNAPFDVHLMAAFGVLGYVFAKLDCEPAPLLLGLHPGADDGGIPAPRHDALARRPDDLPGAPDQRGDAGGGGAGDARRGAAGGARDGQKAFVE